MLSCMASTYRRPPKQHLLKAQARLNRAQSLIENPHDLVDRKSMPSHAIRSQYATEMEIILRQYQKILQQLIESYEREDR